MVSEIGSPDKLSEFSAWGFFPCRQNDHRWHVCVCLHFPVPFSEVMGQKATLTAPFLCRLRDRKRDGPRRQMILLFLLFNPPNDASFGFSVASYSPFGVLLPLSS